MFWRHKFPSAYQCLLCTDSKWFPLYDFWYLFQKLHSLAAFASRGVSDRIFQSLPHPSGLGGFGTASLWGAECPSCLMLGKEQEGTLNNGRSQDMWALAHQRSSFNKIIRKVILLNKLLSSSWNGCRVTMCVRGFLDRS